MLLVTLIQIILANIVILLRASSDGLLNQMELLVEHVNIAQEEAV
jgi:hypothetical protein